MCNNEQLIIEVEEVVINKYSAKTGKLIKSGFSIHTNAWNYSCRCGWFSESNNNFEKPPIKRFL